MGLGLRLEFAHLERAPQPRCVVAAHMHHAHTARGHALRPPLLLLVRVRLRVSVRVSVRVRVRVRVSVRVSVRVRVRVRVRARVRFRVRVS